MCTTKCYGQYFTGPVWVPFEAPFEAPFDAPFEALFEAYFKSPFDAILGPFLQCEYANLTVYQKYAFI